MNQPKIRLYALTTCEYCQSLKRMLVQLALEHEVIELDVLTWDERTKAIEELKKVNPACSFPTTVIDDKVIIGPKVSEIKKILGIRTEADDLFEKLKVINEKKGYYFNGNGEKTYELLQGLLVNKDRYGYMVCPCRLASGSRDKDRDIICPCQYREPDVQEYGSCDCGLYVSADWNKGMIDRVVVPERRSADMY
ncbi:MAG: ferredoxin-thioredoxin reductase catalytic domain-containing protein [Desulfosalsimonadaceae bacterium]|nr:ferredoxin-thioredoxin reductase catalytic domain-containing protein [Desulfosalsimonadaceae bacterium]